jgi:hypothetical protein
MRKLFTVLAAAGVALLGVSAANAGALQSASLTLTVQGQVVGPIVKTTADGLSGNAADNTGGTVAAGSAFNGVTADIPLTTNAAVTNAHIALGNNGQININPAGATVTAPLTGKVDIQNPYGTLFTIPILAGVAGTQTGSAKIPLVGKVLVTLVGTGWHTGTVSASGLTNGGVAIPNVTAHGSFSLSAGGGGTVTLVSLSRVKTSGINVSNTAGPTFLKLTYAAGAVPEPGTLLLLGAGVAGLVAVGRKKRSA